MTSCAEGGPQCQYALDVGVTGYRCLVCAWRACTECGEILTAVEVEFYGDSCDRCEREWNEYMERLRLAAQRR
jgi:hypothetical protein